VKKQAGGGAYGKLAARKDLLTMEKTKNSHANFKEKEEMS